MIDVNLNFETISEPTRRALYGAYDNLNACGSLDDVKDIVTITLFESNADANEATAILNGINARGSCYSARNYISELIRGDSNEL